MKVTRQFGPQGCSVKIETETRSMQVGTETGQPYELLDMAREMRNHARREMERATIIENAAWELTIQALKEKSNG